MPTIVFCVQLSESGVQLSESGVQLSESGVQLSDSGVQLSVAPNMHDELNNLHSLRWSIC